MKKNDIYIRRLFIFLVAVPSFSILILTLSPLLFSITSSAFRNLLVLFYPPFLALFLAVLLICRDRLIKVILYLLPLHLASLISILYSFFRFYSAPFICSRVSLFVYLFSTVIFLRRNKKTESLFSRYIFVKAGVCIFLLCLFMDLSKVFLLLPVSPLKTVGTMVVSLAVVYLFPLRAVLLASYYLFSGKPVPFFLASFSILFMIGSNAGVLPVDILLTLMLSADIASYILCFCTPFIIERKKSDKRL